MDVVGRAIGQSGNVAGASRIGTGVDLLSGTRTRITFWSSVCETGSADGAGSGLLSETSPWAGRLDPFILEPRFHTQREDTHDDGR